MTSSFRRGFTPAPTVRTHPSPLTCPPAGRDKLVVALNSALFFGVGVFALFGGSQYVIDVEPYVKRAKELEESITHARSSPQPALSEFAKKLENISPALANSVRPTASNDAVQEPPTSAKK